MSTLLELAEFSAAAYGSGPAPTTGAPGENGTWQVVGKETLPDGYSAEAWENSVTHEIVIANRGTDLTDGGSTALKNLWSDARLASRSPTQVALDAMAFAASVAKNNANATSI